MPSTSAEAAAAPLESIYAICSDVLLAALAFPGGLAQLGPEAVRERFGGLLDELISEGRRLGLGKSDLAEARYALVAFIDEQILRSSWAGRGDWMRQPLQLLSYRENSAGENFFRRLKSLLQSPERRPALEVYGLCLAAGFQGAYGQSGDLRALEKYRRAVYRRLEAELPPQEAIRLAPAPSTGLERPRPRRALVLALGVACSLSALVIGGCHWSVREACRQAVSELASVLEGGTS
jgi:type VI secretion system protein ImpK